MKRRRKKCFSFTCVKRCNWRWNRICICN